VFFDRQLIYSDPAHEKCDQGLSLSHPKKALRYARLGLQQLARHGVLVVVISKDEMQ
jgi:hypothetical protein